MRKILILGSGLMMAAGVAVGAENVTATKKAPIMTPIENMYGRVEVRQTSVRERTANGDIDSGVRSYKLIPRVGTTAYNNRLNMYMEAYLTNEARTSNYSQKKPLYYAAFSALDAAPFSITPYAQGYYESDTTEDMTTFAAVNFDAGKQVDIIGGKLGFHAGFEPQVTTGTEAQTSSALVRRQGALTLDQNGAPESKTVKNKEPASTLEYIAGLSFTPSAAPKLSIAADSYVDRNFAPTYELKVDGDKETMEKTGYKITDSTLTDIVVAYQADALTKVQSLTRVTQGGVFAKYPRVEQRLSLIQKLF